MPELFVTHSALIAGLANSYFPNYADAEDAIQEANLKLSNVSFDGVDNEGALVYTIASNLFKDLYNKQQRCRETGCPSLLEDLIDEDDPLAVLERYDDERFLENQLSDLPTDISAVATMYYYEGKSYREIAQEFSIPEGTVASRLSAARRYLVGE